MKVKLVQLDGSIMNLALGKLATYHRNKGDTVGFNIGVPDLIYYSAIFDWTARKFKNQQPLGAKAIYGGYPFNDGKLPLEAEFLIPAYDLWEVDYSLGYTSRGCIRACPFCIVPKKEGLIRDYQPIWEFHQSDHKRIILLDNNFFASPRWRQNLDYINDNDLKVNFTQGLDLRIMTEEIANHLAKTRSYNHNFNSRSYHFAWDNIKHERKIREGLDRCIDAGIHPNSIFVYVLTGFDTTFAQDLYRCNILWNEYRVHPYVMRFDGNRSDPRSNALARWANRPAAHRNHTFKGYMDYHGRSEKGKIYAEEENETEGSEQQEFERPRRGRED